MDIRCGYCTQFLGESSEQLEFVEALRHANERLRIPEPRMTWRCGKCGYAMVFRSRRLTRELIEVKTGPCASKAAAA